VLQAKSLGEVATKNGSMVTGLSTYSNVSIIRPGRSRLLEFEKEIVLVV
jgi:hypothetical protein